MEFEMVKKIADVAVDLTKEAVKEGIKESIKETGKNCLEDIWNRISAKPDGFSFLDKSWEQMQIRYDLELAEQKNPAKLCSDIAERLLYDSKTDPFYEWSISDIHRRLDIIEHMLNVMKQEMELPNEVQKNLRLQVGNMEESGKTNFFVKLDGNGDFTLDNNEVPAITMNEKLLLGADADSMRQCMETLFHEAVFVMQECAFLKAGSSFLNRDVLQSWENDIVCRLQNPEKNLDSPAYITGEMGKYADACTALFIEVYSHTYNEKNV